MKGAGRRKRGESVAEKPPILTHHAERKKLVFLVRRREKKGFEGRVYCERWVIASCRVFSLVTSVVARNCPRWIIVARGVSGEVRDKWSRGFHVELLPNDFAFFFQILGIFCFGIYIYRPKSFTFLLFTCASMK